MIKLISLLTLGVILGALAFGLWSLPGTDPVAAREDVMSRCVLRQVALDQGYGVTRTEIRLVCRNT